MRLPFSVEQFFAVFVQYNTTVWPAQCVLFALGLIAVVLVLWPRARSGSIVSAILALLWAWLGVVYHLMFFTAINPLAIAFAVLCLVGCDSATAPVRALGQVARLDGRCIADLRALGISGAVVDGGSSLPGLANVWTPVPHHYLHVWSVGISGPAVSMASFRCSRALVAHWRTGGFPPVDTPRSRAPGCWSARCHPGAELEGSCSPR